MPGTSSPEGSTLKLEWPLRLCPWPLGRFLRCVHRLSSPPHPRNRVAPSQPLPAVGGVGSSWENRLGAAPPLGRGGRHLAGSSGGRRHRCTHLVPVPPAPARPPLPSLTGLPWTGPPSPGSRPCGTRRKTISRNSGEARAWARARGGCPPPPAQRRWSGGEPWASALGAPSLPLPETRQDPAGSSLLEVGGDRAVLSYLLGCLRCPGPRWGLSFSVCQRHLSDTGLGESGSLAHSNCSET